MDKLDAKDKFIKLYWGSNNIHGVGIDAKGVYVMLWREDEDNLPTTIDDVPVTYRVTDMAKAR